jgi:hypothetical protein
MMEYKSISLNQEAPFRKVDLKTHVSHLLLSGADRRFQTHLSFLFVMGNLLQRRQAGFNAKLAVKRSWFPKVNKLFQQITPDTVSTYQEKLKKNPFAKAESSGEKAASELMR